MSRNQGNRMKSGINAGDRSAQASETPLRAPIRFSPKIRLSEAGDPGRLDFRLNPATGADFRNLIIEEIAKRIVAKELIEGREK
jgi:hypothetical protein